MLSIEVIIISIVVIAIWTLIEIKRMKHKIFAIFLIALILLSYIGFSHTLRSNDIDLKTIGGLSKATKLYFLWLGSVFGNMKSITTNAIQTDWTQNQISNQTNSS